MEKSKSQRTQTNRKADDFESVAKRLGCDPDLKEFDKKLERVARTQPKTENGK